MAPGLHLACDLARGRAGDAGNARNEAGNAHAVLAHLQPVVSRPGLCESPQQQRHRVAAVWVEGVGAWGRLGGVN